MRTAIVGTLLLLALLAACAHSAIRASSRAADPGAMLVGQVIVNPSREWFHRSGWFRLATDMTTPARVYVSGGRWACVLQTAEVHEPRPGDYYVCAAGWRPISARHSGT